MHWETLPSTSNREQGFDRSSGGPLARVVESNSENGTVDVVLAPAVSWAEPAKVIMRVQQVDSDIEIWVKSPKGDMNAIAKYNEIRIYGVAGDVGSATVSIQKN